MSTVLAPRGVKNSERWDHSWIWVELFGAGWAADIGWGESLGIQPIQSPSFLSGLVDVNLPSIFGHDAKLKHISITFLSGFVDGFTLSMKAKSRLLYSMSNLEMIFQPEIFIFLKSLTLWTLPLCLLLSDPSPWRCCCKTWERQPT